MFDVIIIVFACASLMTGVGCLILSLQSDQMDHIQARRKHLRHREEWRQLIQSCIDGPKSPKPQTRQSPFHTRPTISPPRPEWFSDHDPTA